MKTETNKYPKTANLIRHYIVRSGVKMTALSKTMGCSRQYIYQILAKNVVSIKLLTKIIDAINEITEYGVLENEAKELYDIYMQEYREANIKTIIKN